MRLGSEKACEAEDGTGVKRYNAPFPGLPVWFWILYVKSKYGLVTRGFSGPSRPALGGGVDA